MDRTTIMLPAELKMRAVREARKRRISFAELIRDALEAMLGAGQKQRLDPLFADNAVFKGSVPEDLSADVDRYLYDDEGR